MHMFPLFGNALYGTDGQTGRGQCLMPLWRPNIVRKLFCNDVSSSVYQSISAYVMFTKSCNETSFHCNFQVKDICYSVWLRLVAFSALTLLVGPGIHVLDGSPCASRGRGCFWHGFRHFSKFRIHWFEWRHGILIMVLIDDWLVCEKLTIFPYAECNFEFCEGLAFLWYSQVQDRSGGWREIHVQKCNKTNATRPLRQQRQRCTARRPYAWPRSHCQHARAVRSQ